MKPLTPMWLLIIVAFLAIAPNTPAQLNESAGGPKHGYPVNASSYLRDIERTTFERINNERTANGLTSLIWSEDVADLARLHSEEMVTQNYFSHEGADGRHVNGRTDERHLHWRSIGENIVFLRGNYDPGAHAVESWMKSPGHKRNILSKDWKESGLGVAVSATGEYYFTQVFILRK